jgi:hypothetical protein
MKLTLLCLIVLTQSACACLTTIALTPTRTEHFATRPDSPSARLTCNGAPCNEARGSRTIVKANPWVFAAVVAAETACTVASLSSSRQPGEDPSAVAYACGGLLGWDLTTLGLSLVMHEDMFRPRITEQFDSVVELSLNGDKAVLSPWFLRREDRIPEVFSAQAALDKGAGVYTNEASTTLCSARWKSARVPYQVLPIDGDESGRLRAAIVTRLEKDLGPPSPRSGYRVESWLAQSPGLLKLEVHMRSGADNRELGQGTVMASSMDELIMRVPLISTSLYGACP